LITTINPVEAVWLVVSLFALVVTLGNLGDAWQGWRENRRAGRAREIQARANVRREAIMLSLSAALVVVVLPALGRPGDTPLSFVVVAIMALPAGIALNSYLDRRTRRTLEQLGVE
jgi:Flp pilus assembly protein TadB